MVQRRTTSGCKVAAQNLADVAAMGAVPTALLVSLVADPGPRRSSGRVDLAAASPRCAEQAGAPVVGGDLSSAPPGVVVVSVTALGDLRGRAPVLRSGARPGDVVAVCGTLGWSGGGLALLRRGGPTRPRPTADAGRPRHAGERPPPCAPDATTASVRRRAGPAPRPPGRTP